MPAIVTFAKAWINTIKGIKMYKSRIIYIFLLINLFFSCRQESKEINIQPHGYVTLIDSTANKEDAMLDDMDRMAYYPVYYVGTKTDTIRLGREPISSLYVETRDEKYDTAKKWAKFTNINVNISVDTTSHLTYANHYFHYGEDNEVTDSTDYYKAFPIYITNFSDSLLLIGTHNIIRKMVRETLDKNGQWIGVKHRFAICVELEVEL